LHKNKLVLLLEREIMKTLFVRSYLLATAIILTTTALAKYPAIFHARTWCTEEDILKFELGFTNEQLLGFAALMELLQVGLICFSSKRWLPCIASAAWGFLCFFARLLLMDPYALCRCLGWIAKPSLVTNMMVTLLALALAGGGWIAFRISWQNENVAKTKPGLPPR